VGVIDLPSFYRDTTGERRGEPDFKSTTRDVRKILEDFKRQGINAVVLDLRRNGGGSLPEAISLTGLFIKNGPVVQVKDGDGHVQPCYDPDPDIVWSGPLVVLISKLSANACQVPVLVLAPGHIEVCCGPAIAIADQSTPASGSCGWDAR
jgi:carboxyl-terminal processing protease